MNMKIKYWMSNPALPQNPNYYINLKINIYNKNKYIKCFVVFTVAANKKCQ